MPRYARRILSNALLAAGLVAVLAASLATYASSHILDSKKFADETVSTLNDSAVREIVSARITNRVLAEAPSALVTFRPAVQSAAEGILDTAALKQALRLGVLTAHEAIIERKQDSAALTVANVGGLLRSTLQQVNPTLADQVPPNLNARILDLSNQPALVDIAQAADKIDSSAGILPVLAVGLLAGAIGLSTERRNTIIGIGVGLIGVGLLIVIAFYVARFGVLHVAAEGRERDAGSAVWGAFFDGLRNRGLWLGVFGVAAIAGAAAFGGYRQYEAGGGGRSSGNRRAWDDRGY